MDIVKMGTDILSEKLGTEVDAESIRGALSGLLGDGEGGVDLAGLVSRMTASGDLSSIVNSWLGDGANDAISPDKVKELLGDDRVAEFAGKLGADPDAAADGLSSALPEMLDKASSGGSLLDSVGGVGGLLDAAKSFLS